MIRRALPFVIALIALLAGAVGGELLRGPAAASAGSAPPAAGEMPAPADAGPVSPQGDGAAAPPPAAQAHGEAAGGGGSTSTQHSSFRFPQQFFVPLVRGGNVTAMMVLTLSVEMPTDAQEAVFAKENQMRDAILRQLLIHANTGGFDGNFTAEAHLALLRRQLLASVQRIAPEVDAVLVGDIVRQEG